MAVQKVQIVAGWQGRAHQFISGHGYALGLGAGRWENGTAATAIDRGSPRCARLSCPCPPSARRRRPPSPPG